MYSLFASNGLPIEQEETCRCFSAPILFYHGIVCKNTFPRHGIPCIDNRLHRPQKSRHISLNSHETISSSLARVEPETLRLPSTHDTLHDHTDYKEL